MLFAALLLAACAVLARASDTPFFFNNVTGSSTWIRPASMPYFSDEGRAYWVHDGVPSWTATEPRDRWTSQWEGGSQFFVHENGTTTWDRPEVFGWSARSSVDSFWYNKVSHATQHERPAVLGHESEEHNATYYMKDGVATWEAPPDSSWVEVHDEATRRPYYSNPKTGDVTWEAPAHSNVAWTRWFSEVNEKEFR